MNLPNQKSDQFSFPKEVSSALSAGAPVVALESTITSHGLPRPENLQVAIEVEETVRSRDAVPATIAMLEGRVHIGLGQDDLEQIATRDDVIKTRSAISALLQPARVLRRPRSLPQAT